MAHGCILQEAIQVSGLPRDRPFQSAPARQAAPDTGNLGSRRAGFQAPSVRLRHASRRRAPPPVTALERRPQRLEPAGRQHDVGELPPSGPAPIALTTATSVGPCGPGASTGAPETPKVTAQSSTTTPSTPPTHAAALRGSRRRRLGPGRRRRSTRAAPAPSAPARIAAARSAGIGSASAQQRDVRRDLGQRTAPANRRSPAASAIRRHLAQRHIGVAPLPGDEADVAPASRAARCAGCRGSAPRSGSGPVGDQRRGADAGFPRR